MSTESSSVQPQRIDVNLVSATRDRDLCEHFHKRRKYENQRVYVLYVFDVQC